MYSGGSRKLLCLRIKCAMKIERKKQRKKDKKTTDALYIVTREMRARLDKRQHFIVGDIDSTLIEGTINVFNFSAREWFFGRGHTNERH